MWYVRLGQLLAGRCYCRESVVVVVAAVVFFGVALPDSLLETSRQVLTIDSC